MVKQLFLFWVWALFLYHLSTCVCVVLGFSSGLVVVPVSAPCNFLCLKSLVIQMQIFIIHVWLSHHLSAACIICVNARITDLRFLQSAGSSVGMLGAEMSSSPWWWLFKASCILERWGHHWVHPYCFCSVIRYGFNSITHSASIYWALALCQMQHQILKF